MARTDPAGLEGAAVASTQSRNCPNHLFRNQQLETDSWKMFLPSGIGGLWMRRTIFLYVLSIFLPSALILVCFNPGYMNIDTMAMWGQAKLHTYRDWHPVLISVLWSQLHHLYHGPQSALVVEDLLFCVGALLVLRRSAPPWKTLLLLWAAALFPPVFAYLGTIGKDSMFAASMVFTVGLYYVFKDSHNKFVFCICLIAGFLAFAARQNGVFAVAPILGLLFWEALRAHRGALGLSVSLVILTVVTYTAAGALINSAVRAQAPYPYQPIPLYDLAAISAATDTLVVPSEFLSPTGSIANIAQSTNTRYVNPLLWGAQPPLRLSYNHDDVHKLLRIWLNAIRHHPLIYLHWRWRLISTLAGFDKEVVAPTGEIGVVPNNLHVRFHHTWMALAEIWLLDNVCNSLLFLVYVYLLFLLAFVISGINKGRIDVATVTASGLSYFLAYFFISINSEFRFACYSVFIAVILAAQWVGDRTLKGSQ